MAHIKDSAVDVSVIIPTYNRLWCLPDAIESCRNTKCTTEIIVVDDGSTDGTWDWLQKQPDVIGLRQSNMGKCWAVNKAFAIANGKYIRFLDSDDKIEYGANDEQFTLAERMNSDVVVSGYRYFDNAGVILKTQFWINCTDFIAQQLGECDSSHYSSYLFSKKFIEDIYHRPDFAFRDDRLFVLELSLKKPKVAVHETTALLHRIHLNERLQISEGLKQTVQNYQHLNLYKEILSRLRDMDELTDRRVSAATKVLWPLAHWIALYHPKEAADVVKWIYELHPAFQIPEQGFLGLLYKRLGFSNTEKLLRFRRILMRN